MWEFYKRTFVRSQVMILAVTGAMYWLLKLPAFIVLVAFVLMQVSGFLGAWFGARLKQRLEAEERKLPLER